MPFKTHRVFIWLCSHEAWYRPGIASTPVEVGKERHRESGWLGAAAVAEVQRVNYSTAVVTAEGKGDHI